MIIFSIAIENFRQKLHLFICAKVIAKHLRDAPPVMPDLIVLLHRDAAVLEPRHFFLQGHAELLDALPPVEPGRVVAFRKTNDLLCKVKGAFTDFLLVEDGSEVAHHLFVVFLVMYGTDRCETFLELR